MLSNVQKKKDSLLQKTACKIKIISLILWPDVKFFMSGREAGIVAIAEIGVGGSGRAPSQLSARGR